MKGVLEENMGIQLGMLNALFGLIAENMLLRYVVHCVRSNDGNKQLLFFGNAFNVTPGALINQIIMVDYFTIVSIVWFLKNVS